MYNILFFHLLLYYLIFLLSVIYTAIFINIKHELKLNLNSKILIGRVESISLSGNKLSLIVKNKEKVNYYKLVPNYLKLPQALEDKKVKE